MTTTTFQGKPKPAGKPGHFYEPMRHSLQAKGIKTGNMSNNAVYEQYGIQNLEKKSPIIPDNSPKTSTGLRDTQQESIQEKEATKKPSFTEKLRKVEEKVGEGIKRTEENVSKNLKEFKESLDREKELRAKERKERLYGEVGRKYTEPEPEVEAEEVDEDADEPESESMPQKLGRFLADINNDYTPEDMVGLNDRELEMLAVRFKSDNKDNISPFGDPENVFLDEMKRRIEARDEIRKEKALIQAELRHPKKEKGLIEELTED